jgi:hypothetical protein
MRKRYHYTTYSQILGKSFQDSKEFESDSDFRLFMYALFHGNWNLDSVEDIKN